MHTLAERFYGYRLLCEVDCMASHLTITQEYWRYFWEMVEDYTSIFQTQALFIDASAGVKPWLGQGGYKTLSNEPLIIDEGPGDIPGFRETLWRDVSWTPNVSANHYYSRVLANKTTMLGAFISFMDRPVGAARFIDERLPTTHALAQGLFEFIEFLFFTNDGERGGSAIDVAARKAMIIKLAGVWLYDSPMSKKQGVDVFMGQFSSRKGQLVIKMSNPGGEGGSHRTGDDDDDPDFVVVLDEVSTDIKKVFDSLLENDIWGVDQTRNGLEAALEENPIVFSLGDSVVEICCGIPLMLYMMILFLTEVGFNQNIGAATQREEVQPFTVGTPFPNPEISKELSWTSLMNLFEDSHSWKSVINRRESDP